MHYKIGMYMPLVVTVLLLIAAWLCGDWKNWRQYYPTILFTMNVNFFSSILTYDHWLWYFEKTFFIPNHTMADFFVKFTNFPPLILLYLSRFPFKSKWLNQLFYIVIWVAVFAIIESIFFWTKMTTYYNGWSLWWSLLLWSILFPVSRIHHTRPLWAWLICLGFTVFVVIHFHIPIAKMK